MMDQQHHRPLISFCTFGRDDDYVADFRYRLTTSVNYMARTLAELGRLADVEFVIVDWGSNPPMQRTLPLSKEAAGISRFVYVSQEVTDGVTGRPGTFHTAVAQNVAMRRALGEFVCVMPADTFLTSSSLERLLRLVAAPGGVGFDASKVYWQIPRIEAPWGLVKRGPDLSEWELEITRSMAGWVAGDEMPNLCTGGGAGMLLVSRGIVDECGGANESMGGWGGQDMVQLDRYGASYGYCDTFGLGILSVHMAHPPSSKSGKERPRGRKLILPLGDTTQHTSEGGTWGLGGIPLSESRALPMDAASGGCNGGCEAMCSPSPERELATRLASAENRNSVKRIAERYLRIDRKAKRVRLRVLRSQLQGASGLLAEHDLIAVVAAWCHLSPPKCLCEIGPPRLVAGVATQFSPACAVFLLHEQLGEFVLPDSWVGWVRCLRKGGNKGYLRSVNGPLTTSVSRARQQEFGLRESDLVVVHVDALGGSLQAVMKDVADTMVPGGCAILHTETPGLGDELTTICETVLPHCTVVLVGTVGTTVLAIKSRGAEHVPPSPLPAVRHLLVAQPLLWRDIEPSLFWRVARVGLRPWRLVRTALRAVVGLVPGRRA